MDGRKGSAREVFLVFLKLGLTSFGGPIAHLGYFREEFVVRRRWLDERAYADVVALCQFLPGPASSQVGMAVGLYRAGLGGALAAWTGFTLPSAVALVLFAYGVAAFGDLAGGGWLHGLKVAAVAVVALAVHGMAATLAPDRIRASIAIAAAAVVLSVPSAAGQLAAIALGALAGLALTRAETPTDHVTLPVSVTRRTAVTALAAFAVLVLALPVTATLTADPLVERIDAFFRAGSLVFGGGHVVLPLLQAEVVPPGWVDDDTFLAGYGAAQAVPGPLFTFAAYLGAAMDGATGGVGGAIVCLVAVFTPSLLLVVGALPFWEALRSRARVQVALRGVNAAVVGLLLAALYHPVFTAAILGPADFALASAALLLLACWRTPPWAVVILCALGGAALAA